MTSTQKIRVLVFPCGSEPALEIHTALSQCVNIELHGASSRQDHGEFVYRRYHGGVPYLNAPDFLIHFNAILRRARIDVVFATHDTAAQFLGAHRDQLAARLCVGDQQTVELCRNKADTYAFFRGEDFCPKVYASSDVSAASFPVFLKPAVDEGGKGARAINSAEELAFYASRTATPVIMEHLPGAEYTVDCFTDRHGTLRFFGPRTRDRVWAGVSVRSCTLQGDDEINRIAERINERLQFRGLWFFQLKRHDDGGLRLLEISSRVAGTMSLYRVKGVNLPLLTVYDAMDQNVSVAANQYPAMVERALLNRYRLDIEYDEVYVDLDDTLILNGRVNGVLLMFLYQARESAKRVTLVTKHTSDPVRTLVEHAIDPALFNQIVHLPLDAVKFQRMTAGVPAIFIDNAFAERAPALAAGIPVFDVDAVHGLIDWRS